MIRRTYARIVVVYVGLTLQILGIVLILVGAFKAAQELGAVERWSTGAQVWVSDRARRIRAVVVRVVLRRREPVVVSPATIRAGADVLQAHGVVSEPPWASLDHDEKFAALRRQVDSLRDLVDRNDEQARGRLGGVEARLAEFESTVDERFGGHDARDQAILGYELAGGAVSLLGTVIVIFA